VSLRARITLDIRKQVSQKLYGKGHKESRTLFPIRGSQGIMITLPGVKKPIPLVACSIPDALDVIRELENNTLNIEQ
jgi:hypothetical protein